MDKIIKTQRLVLKSLKDENKADMFDLLSDQLIKKTYMIPDFSNEEELNSFFEKLKNVSQKEDRFVFGIFLKEKCIGFLNEVEKNDKVIELGYFISSKCWNKGYASEALRAAILELFIMGYKTVKAAHFENNLASGRVMQKCGMKKTNEEQVVEYKGISYRCIFYEINNVNYRKAVISDIDEIMIAIEDGRAYLKPQKSGQWQDGDPSRENILKTIKENHFYVVLTPNNEIASVAALTYEEEDYEHLYEGSWISFQPYMVMHRVAVKDKYRHQGYGNALFLMFELEAKKQGYHSLRIDTHEKNVPMQNLIKKNGFIYCGKTILKPDKDRMVFEKII